MNKLYVYVASAISLLAGLIIAFMKGKSVGKEEFQNKQLRENEKIVEKLNKIDYKTSTASDDDVRNGMREFTRK
jgi:glucose-6-phosphate isomerase